MWPQVLLAVAAGTIALALWLGVSRGPKPDWWRSIAALIGVWTVLMMAIGTLNLMGTHGIDPGEFGLLFVTPVIAGAFGIGMWIGRVLDRR